MLTTMRFTFIFKRCLSANARNVSVDQKEMDMFANLSKIWWDPNGPMKLLHEMTPCKVQILRDFLLESGKVHQHQEKMEQPLRGLSILDVGCGGGIFAETVAKLGAQVTGVDSCSDLVECAQNHLEKQETIEIRPTYICDTIENYSQVNANSFDVVVASEVIEHVANKDIFAKHSLECLKPGGSAYFTTMNRTWPSGFYYIFVGENIFKTFPKGVHEYDKFMKPVEMAEMFEKYNCKPTHTKGFTVSPFTDKWYPVPIKTFNFAMHAIKY